jgi:hypothetical protein
MRKKLSSARYAIPDKSGFNLNKTCQGCPANSINTLPGGTGANDCACVLIGSANWLEGAEPFG